jgi:hypothetical protein
MLFQIVFVLAFVGSSPGSAARGRRLLVILGRNSRD